MLFPYLELNATADPAEMAKQANRKFDQSSILEIILADHGSRVKFLYMLARLAKRTKVSAQIAPRRRDFRGRALVTKGGFASDTDDFEVIRVSSRTDPARLAESMRIALFKDNSERKDVELRIIGPGSATAAMFALEQLRFDTWRDIRFTARFAEMASGSNSKTVGVVVTLGISSSGAEAQQDDLGGEQEAPEGDGDEMPLVRWTPPLTPDLFPTFFVGSKTGTMRLGTKLTASLSVCSTSIVEVLLLDKDGRARLLYMLASLPPWLEAVAQVAPRRRDHRSRLRVIRDYPFREAPREPILRVSALTEPQRLAQAMFSRLVDRTAPEEAVGLQLIGPEAASRTLLALEHLQAASKREVSFRARFVNMREDGEEVMRGVMVTVVAT